MATSETQQGDAREITRLMQAMESAAHIFVNLEITDDIRRWLMTEWEPALRRNGFPPIKGSWLDNGEHNEPERQG